MKKIAGIVKKHKILTAICLLAVVLLVFWALTPKNPTAGYREETVTTRDIVTYNSFVGNVGFVGNMNVLSKASAEIIEVLVEAGDTVSKGDVIATLDSEALEKNIEKTEIALKNQKIANEHTLADAQRAYDNFKYALDNGLNSTLNGARTQLETARKNYNTLLDSFTSYVDNLEIMLINGYKTDGRVVVDARNAYHDAIAEYEYLENVISQKTQEYENSKNVSEADLNKLDQYKEMLVGLEKNIHTAREEYEIRVRNYADNNDSNFKTIVDNLENALTALNNATESYNAVELQINQQLESYKASLKKAQDTLTLESAEKELQILKDTLEDYKIVSPCDGVITALNIEDGNMTAAGSVAATVSNLEDLEITIKVDEYSVLNTQVGKDVTVYVDSIGRTYDGKITWISNNATIENGVSYFKATVEFTADEYVRGGMSVEVRLKKAESLGAVSISVDSVNYREDNTAFVYVLDGEGELEEKDISLGISDGIYVEITEGLSDGDKILYVPGFSFMIPIPGGDFGG